ncbi:Serine/threonine-protein kinase STY8 [Zea mays]|uniref:Serine/threonine-protein kinase STY8 n=1 Tax=Zea mays TaxID=4577 RepID=A0A317YK46_MAIZE|nr:Serine/threonine-protein kinase STY8 [Zea mays]
MEDEDDKKEVAVVGSSAADPVADSSAADASHEYTGIEKEIFDRLLERRIDEAVYRPSVFREQLHRHFKRLPRSYAINLNAEDVLLHSKILECAADPDKRPVFHARFLKCIHGRVVDSKDNPWGSLTTTSRGFEP